MRSSRPDACARANACWELMPCGDMKDQSEGLGWRKPLGPRPQPLVSALSEPWPSIPPQMLSGCLLLGPAPSVMPTRLPARLPRLPLFANLAPARPFLALPWGGLGFSGSVASGQALPSAVGCFWMEEYLLGDLYVVSDLSHLFSVVPALVQWKIADPVSGLLQTLLGTRGTFGSRRDKEIRLQAIRRSQQSPLVFRNISCGTLP